MLAQLGRGEAQSMETYRRYMADGVSLGRRPELVGARADVGVGNGRPQEVQGGEESGNLPMHGFWGVASLSSGY